MALYNTNMKAQNTPFKTMNSCPTCGDTTSVIKLGSEPAREICPALKCGWDGVTLE
jgi:transcription elongation factor Elf1